MIVPPEEIPVEDEPVQSESGKRDRNARDLEIINQNAERLNEEALDTLNYQVELWDSEVKDEE